MGYFLPILKKTFIFWDDYNFPVCDNPKECLVFFLNLGLRSGGGIGDVLFQPNRDNDGGSEYIARHNQIVKMFYIVLLLKQ
ncbi:hypothetical protein IMG5_169290 [Ichthyophthirius multifiliis]|uniref:Uncharacterized protein n=1 Tax=Ichthyophthirius multifiliis TaxID=5932 RepID=G0R199_ICHMU|nr:hypothetical protein IMG5_169290 [Ichthyophthirius multifiliis]EGR28732.1 hypothetical protein IMG5_169290 [Ichthyophthirius multifiliis]|eukprot:XP_004029968.1 hypothetical protein IMG5_169290 [Ichthyophthirius multifiliis]